MLETLFSSTLGETLTIGNILCVTLAALVLGAIISGVYLITHRKSGWQQSFVITLVMLPATLTIVIMLVGNNIARAFSLGGAISIIRFRSAPGDAKDIAYIFFTLAVGLGCGMGYIGYAVVFTIIMTVVMLVLELTNYAAPKNTEMSLKITIPESLNFQHLFDEILTANTVKWKLKKVRTADFGSLFELVYDIDLKDTCDQKGFLDALRVRNGNMPIQLTLREYEERLTM